MQLVITPVGDVRCLYDESLDLIRIAKNNRAPSAARDLRRFQAMFCDRQHGRRLSMTVVDHHWAEELQTLFQREREARLAKNPSKN